MSKFICQKVGMSQIFMENGTVIPVTILSVQKNYVVSAHQHEKRNIVQIAAFEQKSHRVKKPILGIFKKSKISPKKIIKSFITKDLSIKTGDVRDVTYFKIGQFVDITGKTLGKGFSGVMKRHNFSGLEASHGVSLKHRSGGSTGQCQDPGKVFKGKKMAGRQGGTNNTIQNIKIINIDVERELLVVAGSVPGPKNNYLIIKQAIKK